MVDVLLTVFVVTALALLWVALYDSNRFVVVRHEFRDRRVRKPYRAVVLADLHNKSFGRNNERLLDAIREQKPDGIFVAGDLLTAKKGESLDTAVNLLRELAAEYPVFYGNGNHEHRLELYPEVYGSMGKEYEEALHGLGVDRLVNEHVTLEEFGLAVYGAQIDKFYYKRFKTQFMDGNYLTELLGSPREGVFCVLLAHNPDYFPKYASWGADVVFAGHVHGGMIRVPFWKGVLSPAVRFFPKYDGGVYKEGKCTMLLSRGLGMHTIPLRLFNPGELLTVDFLPEDGDIGAVSQA